MPGRFTAKPEGCDDSTRILALANAADRHQTNLFERRVIKRATVYLHGNFDPSYVTSFQSRRLYS